ncbi:lytic transglycosylase domain-containing protein [Aureimonas phyllosphaerae]|uniref:Soluble lytic murein transglycosylase-like protein n=1 Tax=Aureimonas phyllosphaerae TaxID=1166078 RepID=A0A7W6BX30_9HYPH|nr:transglycosylase SLT domain-containing protein [Aureimonas phyllosphaerae]MBB3934347.1 soluble lytic murein transglycosylase-like protein [Aureimonas phyllosphaerae]MBB3958437.1 soluble lytic murein transglycosylase-like protein [Aureimonas phyllosphaerae]SFE97034.1 Transglycosylase SLT domain-containing protein [Aureimonas phyllosphaerae]
MNRLPAAACAATLLLAQISAAQADTASSTSLAPVAEPSISEQKPTDPVEDTNDTLAGRPFADIIAREAKANDIPVELAHAIVSVESNYKVEVTGRAGEIGLMQIKPATARDMGFEGDSSDLYNPAVNIKYGMKYLAGAERRGGGTLCGTILKYNAGHYSKRMNPTSARYCQKVKTVLASL